MVGNIISCILLGLCIAFLICVPFIDTAECNRKIKKLIQEHGKITKVTLISETFDTGWNYCACIEKHTFSGKNLELTCISSVQGGFKVKTKRKETKLYEITEMKFKFEDGSKETLRFVDEFTC